MVFEVYGEKSNVIISLELTTAVGCVNPFLTSQKILLLENPFYKMFLYKIYSNACKLTFTPAI